MQPIENLKLFEKFNMLFEPFDRVALLTSDHELLHLKYAALADIGTLQQSAEVCHKYLQIQDGDIVITNDPYSGGTILSSPTLVLGIGNRAIKGTVPAEFLVAFRLSLSPRAVPAKTIDEEGLRIPPSPLFLKGEPNNAIVEALRSHPQTHNELLAAVEKAAIELLNFRQEFKRQMASGELSISRAQIKNYLADCEALFAGRIEEFREGSGSVELQMSATETLKLRLEHHEGHLVFDFAGTSQGTHIFVTDSALFGAAVGTVLSLFETEAPINSGLFRRFEIKAPRGSLVNAAFPKPLYLGHTDGLCFIANAISMCASQIDSRLGWASSGSSFCSYQLRFKDQGKDVIYWDALPTGAGATAKSKGADGVFVWRRIDFFGSLETTESRFPIQHVNVGFRANSGGTGQHEGGRGVAKTIRLLEPAELAWQFLAPLHKPEGLSGGKSALGPEMIHQSASGEKKILPSQGVLQLSKGDELTILSPGGGGYGQ